MSDKKVVEEGRRNSYFQAFCDMDAFQWELPRESSDFCHFRKRIGEKGIEKTFQASIEIYGETAMKSEIVVNATVWEKITLSRQT